MGNFSGSVNAEEEIITDIQVPTIEELMLKLQQDEELEIPRLKVEIKSDDIEYKVDLIKNTLLINPTATIRVIKKALLDSGFKIINDEEIQKIIKQATDFEKYNELYPQKLNFIKNGDRITKAETEFVKLNIHSTPKELEPIYNKKFKNSRKNVKDFLKNALFLARHDKNSSWKPTKRTTLTSIQRDFLISNANYDDNTLLSMFNIKFPTDVRKLHMIHTFFKFGAGKNTNRLNNITEELPKIIPTNEKISNINLTDWTEEEKEFLEPYFQNIITNCEKITKKDTILLISKQLKTYNPNHTHSDKSIRNRFYASESYKNRPKDYKLKSDKNSSNSQTKLQLNKTNLINKMSINQLNNPINSYMNQHLLAPKVLELIRSGVISQAISIERKTRIRELLLFDENVTPVEIKLVLDILEP